MELTLHLTAACTLKCGYCHDAYGETRRYPTMSADVAVRAVDLLLAEDPKQPSLFFYGGEPLLAEAVIRHTVAHVRAREALLDVKVGLHTTTNGTRLTDDFLAFAARERLHIALSCDGNRAAHDIHRRFHNGTGSFDVVDDALKRLLAVQPYAPVRTTITPLSVPHLPDSFDHLLDRGARCLIWAVDFTSPWTPDDMRALGKAYRAIARRYQARTRLGERFYFSPFDGKLSSHIKQDRDPRYQCKLALSQISVAPDGTLMPYVEWVRSELDPEWTIGHVDSGIDRRAQLKVNSRSGAPRPECGGCAIEGRCIHWCSCLNFRTTGCVDRVSPVVCAHERTLVPIADDAGARLYRLRDPHFIQKHYNDLYPFLSLLEDLSKRGAGRAG